MNKAFAVSALQVQLMTNISAVFQDHYLLSHNKQFMSSSSQGRQAQHEISQVNSGCIETGGRTPLFLWSQLASNLHKLTLMKHIEQQKLQ